MKKKSNNLKIIKLTAKMLKTPEALLRAVGAVDEKERRAFPSHVYLNPEDVFKMEKNVYKQLKKDYPHTHESKLISSVGYAMLDLGPVDDESVQVGTVLVDIGGIENERKQNVA